MIQKWMEICESEKIAAIKLIWKFEKKKTEAEMKNWKAAHVYRLQLLDSGFRLHAEAEPAH